MVTVEICEDLEDLRPLARDWMADMGEDFGMEIDLDTIKADLDLWSSKGIGITFIAREDGKVVAFLPVMITSMFLGKQPMAFERYWYWKPGKVFAGRKLLDYAKAYARQQGCTHFVMSASAMGTKLHDKMCQVLEKYGMQKFETNYITEL